MTRTTAGQAAEPDPGRQDAFSGGGSRSETTRQRRNELADRWERRLAVPVVLAAAVSVPAVFLTIFGDDRPAQVGNVLNWASLIVLTAEAVVLFLLTGDRLEWVRRHKWTLAITAVAVPAVIFAIAPVQALRVVLRLVHFAGALRVLRAGRIIKAGRVLARRSGWTGPWRYAPILIGSILAAGLVAVILADETSTTRQLLENLGPGWLATGATLLAGAILAAATFVVIRYRNR